MEESTDPKKEEKLTDKKSGAGKAGAENGGLDRQVEITILQRQIKTIEDSIAGNFRPKPLIIMAIVGIIFGLFYAYVTLPDYKLDRNSHIEDYFDTCRHSNAIIDDYIRLKEPYIIWIDLEYDHLTSDSLEIADYSPEQVKTLHMEIDREIESVEEKLRAERKVSVIWDTMEVTFIVLGIYILLSIFSISSGRARISRYKLQLTEIGANELQKNLKDDKEDFFTRLVQINFKYLDQYYLQTQEQADKSFWTSVLAAGLGFILVITGVIMMYSGKIDPGYVATSAGVISEFVAAVFFYLYNQTIQKMSQYHEKLVLTQNISLALKTADSLTTSKEEVLKNLIERLTTDINKYLANSHDCN